MNLVNIPEDFIVSCGEDEIEYDFDLTIFKKENKLRFSACGKSTSWMSFSDFFVRRIQFEKLNPCFRKEHVLMEIEIRNLLDEAYLFFEKENYKNAADILDEILYYDSEYGEAVYLKSKVFHAQKHFVKSLRQYEKAVKIEESLKDDSYHMLLLKNSSAERDAFPAFKRQIYTGDEHFRNGEYENAVKCYDMALANHGQFTDRILSKLLSKKATALFKLKDYERAYFYFNKSVKIRENDRAYFHMGIIEYFLNKPLSDRFKGPLRISKNQLIKKAGILNDVGEFELALECLDEYFEGQYLINDRYLLGLNLKLGILKTLGKSFDEVESQIRTIDEFKNLHS